MARSKKHHSNPLLIDLLFIGASIFIAGVLLETGTLAKIITSAGTLEGIGTFIVGAFFTSIFTTLPAMVTLGEIASVQGTIMTALIGAFGAVVGDFFIFQFVRDRLSEHLTELIGEQGMYRRLKRLLRLKSFRWLAFFIGGMVIALPIPDEIGISILGFAKMNTTGFLILSFVFNFIGIFLVGSLATAVQTVY